MYLRLTFNVDVRVYYLYYYFIITYMNNTYKKIMLLRYKIEF